MVLETLTNPIKAEQHPVRMLPLGMIFASIGLFLGKWIFAEQTSLVMVFLTTMAAIPLVYNTIKYEEKKDLAPLSEKKLLKEHSRALLVFMYYFIGTTLGFALWYTVIPSADVSTVFSVQIDTITHIRSNVTGNAIQGFGVFMDILTNNLKVLIFCILFSFLYGLGAIFILTWNASVIGVAIGQFIRSELHQISSTFNLVSAAQYLNIISIGVFKYSIHGIPEILSYFIAGLAGGIISIAAIRHDFATKQFERIVLDSSVLLIISLVMIVAAAVLEVWVTPWLWSLLSV